MKRAGNKRPEQPAGDADASVVNPTRWYASEHMMLPLQCLALFLVIAGYRFAIVGLYGTDLPYWDQWGTEGQELIKRYFDGTLAFSHWFAPSNEHRVFFTRLVALGLTLVNDQWDARVEMLVNAVICSLSACGLFWYFARDLRSIHRWVWYLAVAIIFIFPFGWENTIAGFQSQFYLLACFSFVSIALLGNSPPLTLRWSIGCLVMMSALFTMASGMLAPFAVIALLGITLLRERKEWQAVLKRDFPTYLACAVVAAVGLALMVRLEAHAKYQSHSIFQFLEAFSACLSWPYLGHNWWSLVNWLPFAALLAGCITGFAGSGRSERLALGLGLWVILQSAATAFSRATIMYSSRYTDVLSYGLLVNIICMLLLLKAIRPGWKYAVIVPFALVWLAINGPDLYSLSYNGALDARKYIYSVEAANTGAYIATKDFNHLVPKRDKKEIPFPIPEKYGQMLNDPVLRALLPVGVRPTLPLTPVNGYLAPMNNNLAPLESSLHTGERIWKVPPYEKFEAAAKKRTELPFVMFQVAGSSENLSVTDNSNRTHPVKQLPLGGDGTWRPVYAYCPGSECRITGTGGTALSAFTEPREMGRLSLWGQYAFVGGEKMFWAGIVLSGIAILLSVTGWAVGRKRNNSRCKG